MMELADEIVIPATRDMVYKSLNDIEILKKCFPGCQELVATSDTELAAAYAKFPNPASRFAIVGVFVTKGDSVRVAITGAGEDGVFRHAGLEAALASSFAPESVEPVTVSGDEMISDMHAASDYRAHFVKEMTRRAVAACDWPSSG